MSQAAPASAVASPTGDRLLLLAEVTLAAVTLLALVGLRRLFVDGDFLPNVLASAFAAHVVAAACRRLRLGTGISLMITFVLGVIVVSRLELPETTTLWLPTGETLDVAREQFRDAWQTFGDVVAPAPVLPGFVLAASLGAWLIAFASDAAAFRARATVEAVVPAGTLFVFGGALGTGDDRVLLAALFITAVLVHWLAQRSYTQVSSPTWLASDHSGGVATLLRLGAVLAAVGVAAAVLVGPNLPGADDKAIIPWRATDRDDPGSRVTISPLVDIRSRIVDQADIEVFRVQSEARSYWRLTSLERFDGRIWSSNRQYRPARGSLDAAVDTSDATVDVVTQQFTIGALSSIWLPAAFRPVRLAGTDARYDDDSNSLLTEEDTATGLEYQVESAIPRLTGEQLGTVRPVAPRDIATEYTLLPDGFSPAVQRLAGEIVAGRRSQYDKALALQNFFRGGEFVYDLEVSSGHDTRDLEDFLFRTRRGYCEQFAGAYAAMARVIGLPARVAVGFTPGEKDPATGQFVVRGYNGHAWPEVYLDGFGWVAFEPTPGRGIPGGQTYTGVPEQQADPQDPTSATTVPTTTTTTAPGGPTDSVAPAPTPEETGGLPTDEPSPWPRRLVVAAVVVLVLPLVWAAMLAAIRVRRRHRRRHRAATARDQVLVSWEEVGEALARAGTAPEPWETPHEFAERAATRPGIDRRLIGGLAGLATTATFGRDVLDDELATQAADVAATIGKAADELLDRRERVRYLLDPRPLLPERGARVEVRQPVR